MMENVVLIKSMLRCFELISELEVNFFKSSFGGVGVEREVWLDFAGRLNCRLMSIPFVYLGLPVGANPRKESTWQSIIKKLEKKLSCWKHKLLSFDGRICFTKSCYSPFLFSIYLSLSYLWLLRKKLKKIQSEFLWGVGRRGKKYIGLVGKKCAIL